jgi:hypothetical protein
LDGDLPCTFDCCALVEELVKAENAVDGVPVATDVEGLEDEVEEDEAEDLTITPVTGIRTMQRRKLSNPCSPSSFCRLSLTGLKLILGSDKYVFSLSILTALRVRIPMFTMSRSSTLIST